MQWVLLLVAPAVLIGLNRKRPGAGAHGLLLALAVLAVGLWYGLFQAGNSS